MSRNLYLNGDLATAKARGFDICQMKYDGWWCKCVTHSGTAHYHSETDREFGTSSGFDLDGCILIGEFMRGTQWSQHPDRKGRFFIYDLWAIFGEPITNETYLERYRLLRKLTLPSVYTLVDTYRIDNQPALWERYVLREGWEGVVYRRSVSTLDDAVMREKREYSLEGTVVGFEPGLGKYEGSLGAVRVAYGQNTTSVGGGFTDAERVDIWGNQQTYLGRVMEFTANAIFESGNVRHPRFVRWREDKQ
jgi:ATP-dependent DNA ligase